jgi:hypothetical protein
MINDFLELQERERALFKRVFEFALGGPFGKYTCQGTDMVERHS